MATTMTPSIHTTIPASVEETPGPGLVQWFILADTHCVLLLLLAGERGFVGTNDGHMLLSTNFLTNTQSLLSRRFWVDLHHEREKGNGNLESQRATRSFGLHVTHREASVLLKRSISMWCPCRRRMPLPFITPRRKVTRTTQTLFEIGFFD